MGFYGDRVLPRLVNTACGMKSNEPFRRRACAGLHGRVVEVGFGSGHNVPFYPSAVVEVMAIEPADLAWELAADRVAATAVHVHRGGLDGAQLRSMIEALTVRCPRGRCARSLTRQRHSGRFAAC